MLAWYNNDAAYSSDKWDPATYGRDYDFSKPFFTQLKDLQRAVPRVSLSQENAVNSDWINYERNAKNCYLDVGGEETEDCAYTTYALNSKVILDSYWIFKSDSCYQLLRSNNCFQTHFSFWCFKCTDVWFSYDCSDCSNLIGCIGLRHKNYHIFNQPVSKEEYEKFVAENLNGSHAKLRELQEKVRQFHLGFPRRYSFISKSENASGSFLENSKNVVNAWHGDKLEDSKNIYIAANIKHSYDVSPSVNDEYVYEVLSCAEANNVRFSFVVWKGVFNLDYCEQMVIGHDCFGCIGMRKGEFSILNKKYSQIEYHDLRSKIIEQMKNMPYKDPDGREYRYGEFFPPVMSAFAFNETVAYEYFPLTREETLAAGFVWKEIDRKNIKPTVLAKDLPDNIKDTPENITSQIIACEHNGECRELCNYVFKLVGPEVAFYKKHGLPLPRFCPNCRHFQRIQQLGPRKLWSRQCGCAGARSDNGAHENEGTHFHGAGKCPNKFETSYAPERQEIVYCAECYQNEVI
ncbi:hypothetical protein HY224_01990 [Candidatus Uhrbacteria bacterium]|nr:hypothetical protein [Candidatus Uhrbacteria bacterium]